jgi:hypothetical protein
MVLACGAAYIKSRWNADRARERSDQMVREYLDALTRGEYGAAYGLICTNSDNVDRAWFESNQGRDPIQSFLVESSGDWGNLMDGSGRVYYVRVTLMSGIVTAMQLTTEYTSDWATCISDWQ